MINMNLFKYENLNREVFFSETVEVQILGL